MKKIYFASILIGLSNFSSFTYAEDEHHDHDAHVHGYANLYVVIDEKNIFVEFESPAMNLLGFEHEPHNKEEHEAVSKVNEQLMDYKNVLLFPDSQCEQVEVEMELPYESEEHEEHHGHHEEEHHDHHAHKKEHDHDEHKDSEHSDYFISYSFECKQVISSIELAVFETYPAIEELEVNWVNESKQGAFFAKPDRTLLELD